MAGISSKVKKHVGSLYGSSPLYFIQKKLKDYKKVVIILENNNQALNLREELISFVGDKNIIDLFLNYETLPYEEVLEDKEILSGRVQTIMNKDQSGIVITNMQAILRKLSSNLGKDNFLKKIDHNTKYSEIIDHLNEMKFEKTNLIQNKGEFTIKGPIIDIYPVCSDDPYRLQFDDEFLETIKKFNLDTQITMNEQSSIYICDTSEVLLSNSNIEHYKKKAARQFDREYLEDMEYQRITNNILCPNVHNLIPLIYDKHSTFFSFFDDQSTLYLSSLDIDIEKKKIYEKYQQYFILNKNLKYILEPNDILISQELLTDVFANSDYIELSNFKISSSHNYINESIKKLPSILINNKKHNPYSDLYTLLKSKIYKVYIFITRESLKKEIEKILKDIGLKYNHSKFFNRKSDKYDVTIISGILVEGFIDYENKIAFLGSIDIFGKRAIEIKKTYRKRNLNEYYNDISDLEVGAHIVHDDHGIGIYQGLINMDIEGIKTELLKIEYANKDLLYIPVTSIDQIKKYHKSSGLTIALNHLGTSKWQKIKKKAKQKINDLATDILEIEAKRKLSKGYKYEIDSKEYERFIEEFPFTETEDQLKTLADVHSDMSSEYPMDRLICGDVGFGKTEIIMRASFISAINNKQILLLAPTTLLVEQHYKTFKKRFCNTPINIGKMSRLEKKKSRDTTIDQIYNGKLDILIGTHAVLSNELSFQNLGLLIIDEEHKFGVRAKEKIKKYRGTIDIITLTATPIPRTLNSALSNIRDLSLIESPPDNRKSIVTQILEWDDNILSDAIERELQRGGQIYFVHNDIQTMSHIKERLALINNNMSIGIVHAKLDNIKIETEMNRFINKEYDLIICTSIIESGLDITNVNTIIINNSDKFGLSQLHQIRGRVGRSSTQAYAYLLISNKYKITSQSKHRLEALDSIDSLGGGVEIATKDLELRGAGEILGEEQSGQMYEIGYAMFTDLLKKTIDLLRNGKDKETSQLIIDVNKPCLIPDYYMEDIFLRLKYYQKISLCNSEDDLISIKDEIIDIFGPIPDHLDNLLILKNLKNNISDKKVTYMKIIDTNVTVDYNSHRKDKKKIYKDGNELKTRIRISLDNEDFEKQCVEIQENLNKLF